MLALASNTGFEAMTADELYYINGGSSSVGCSGYYSGPFNWGAEVHYTTDKGSAYAYVQCDNGVIKVGAGRSSN